MKSSNLLPDKKKSQKKGHSNHDVKEMMLQLYDDLFRHDGYGEMKVVMRFIRHNRKEVIIHCGKEYRFVVEYDNDENPKPDA